jgi:hypothetical protein
MATYTHEDLFFRNKYLVKEVNGHIRVEDIHDWEWNEDWISRYEIHRLYNTYKEAEEIVRRTNAEGDKIIDDVYDEREDSKYVNGEDRGYPTFDLKYVFDPIEVREVEGFDGRDSFNGDTFDLSKAEWPNNYIKSMTFKNCKFIGKELEFGDCKLFNCTFSGVKSIAILYSHLEDCDFTQSSNILLDPKRANLIRCKFDGARGFFFKELKDLSGTSGLSAQQTDPKGDRRRNLSEDRLTVEEIVSIREEEERLRREEEEARRKAIQDITRRVSRAKKDKELEALAEEVGSLQARPEYVREYKSDLEDLQAEIERKYSVVGKGIRYLKRLFSRGRKASQIRVASQMNRELQREIKALKRDLNK